MKTPHNNCEICQHKGFDKAAGVICQLTKEKPPVAYTCSSFEKDVPLAKDVAWKQKLRRQDDRAVRFRQRLTIGTFLFFIGFIIFAVMLIGAAAGEAVRGAFGSFFH